MDFDQMMDAWRTQDEKPLYGVNRNLLQMVLQNEQERIRRTLRRDQWVTYLFGPGMALFAAFWLWVSILKGAPLIQSLAAGLGAAILAIWVGAYWVSRTRQARRERMFGNSLQAEVSRNLSLVEYQIANGRWLAALFWTLPVTIGALLIYWLSFQINTSTSFSWWTHGFILFAIIWSVGWTAYAGNREVARTLEPRRNRLRELLATLSTTE